MADDPKIPGNKVGSSVYGEIFHVCIPKRTSEECEANCVPKDPQSSSYEACNATLLDWEKNEAPKFMLNPKCRIEYKVEVSTSAGAGAAAYVRAEVYVVKETERLIAICSGQLKK